MLFRVFSSVSEASAHFESQLAKARQDLSANPSDIFSQYQASLNTQILEELQQLPAALNHSVLKHTEDGIIALCFCTDHRVRVYIGSDFSTRTNPHVTHTSAAVLDMIAANTRRHLLKYNQTNDISHLISAQFTRAQTEALQSLDHDIPVVIDDTVISTFRCTSVGDGIYDMTEQSFLPQLFPNIDMC